MSNQKFQTNHSEIINYPVDYNKFPLTKKCKFIKVELHENQYLYIPNLWNHWVLSDIETVAISFDIKNVEPLTKKNNEIHQKILQRIPFKRNGNEYKFDYNAFIHNSLNYFFRVIYSENDDLSPVIKDETKFKKAGTDILQNIINISQQKNYYAYIGQYDIPSANNFKEITDFIDFDDKIKNEYKDTLFKYNFLSKFCEYDDNLKLLLHPRIWITLDKKINSGLHYDENAKFLYVLSGKKTVFLIPPSYNEYLYFNFFDVI
jgi:hypothetical protein